MSTWKECKMYALLKCLYVIFQVTSSKHWCTQMVHFRLKVFLVDIVEGSRQYLKVRVGLSRRFRVGVVKSFVLYRNFILYGASNVESQQWRDTEISALWTSMMVWFIKRVCDNVKSYNLHKYVTWSNNNNHDDCQSFQCWQTNSCYSFFFYTFIRILCGEKRMGEHCRNQKMVTILLDRICSKNDHWTPWSILAPDSPRS